MKINSSNEIDEAFSNLNKGKEARVSSVTAQRLLQENMTVTTKHGERYLRLHSLGLGVYGVTLAEVGSKEQTFLVKE